MPWRTRLLESSSISFKPSPHVSILTNCTFSCKRVHHEIIHTSERRAINSILCEKFRPRRFCCGRRSDSIFAQKLCEETYQPNSSRLFLPNGFSLSEAVGVLFELSLDVLNLDTKTGELRHRPSIAFAPCFFPCCWFGTNSPSCHAWLRLQMPRHVHTFHLVSRHAVRSLLNCNIKEVLSSSSISRAILPHPKTQIQHHK